MTRSRPPAATIAWQAGAAMPRGLRPWLVRLLAGYLAALGYGGSRVGVLIADAATLRRLNARFRRRARTTDILSFSLRDDPSPAGWAATGLLGDLALSWPQVTAQAKANGWDARTEVARLLAHGCVHLLGHDHRTRAEDAAMLRLEQRLLRGAGYGDLYPKARPSRVKRGKASTKARSK